MFFKKTKAVYNSYNFIGVDIHNHVLPGIDDGAPDAETSLLLMTELKNLGFNKLIPSPHTFNSLYPNTPQTIQASYDLLKKSMASCPNDLPELNNFASEYMMDDYFKTIRSNGKPLSFGYDHVLIEMSFADEAPMLLEEIFQLQLMGCIPVLAHPERYPYLNGNFSYFKALVDRGCQMQLNLLSLTDQYGKGPQKTALKLLDLELYSWAGTDVHHLGHIDLLKQLVNSKHFNKIEDYPFKNRQLM